MPGTSLKEAWIKSPLENRNAWVVRMASVSVPRCRRTPWTILQPNQTTSAFLPSFVPLFDIFCRGSCLPLYVGNDGETFGNAVELRSREC